MSAPVTQLAREPSRLDNAQPNPAPARINLIGLIIILSVYLLLAINISRTMHFSRAFDEGYHLEYITFIKQHGTLPKSYQERAEITRADFPPLYQLLVSLFSANVTVGNSPGFKLFWDSFRYRAMDHQTEEVWTLNTEDFQPPYIGQFLVWQIGRWVSIGLSAATLIVIFLTLRETPLDRIPLGPLVGAATLAFIPRYIILGSTLNDDNLLGLLAALYFWMLVKMINRPQRWWPWLGAGIFLGLSMTVKYSLVVAPLQIIALAIFFATQKKLGWKWAGQRIAVVGLLALLCSSWWFGWNIWYLNTVADDGWLAGLLRPIMAGGTDTTLNRVSGFLSGGQVGLTELPEETITGTFPQWLQTTFLTFWGVGATPLSWVFYALIGVMLIVAIYGLWRLWQANAANRPWLALFVFHIGLFFILPLIRFGLTRRLSVAAQGRHILIPAATAVIALLVLGLAGAMPARWRSPVFGLIVVSFAGWTGLHLVQLIRVDSAPLPLRTWPPAAEWLSTPINAQFGEQIELVSYDLQPEPERGQLRLNLAWRAGGVVNQSYRLSIELVNNAGEVVSHWIGYNGNGRLPTLSWEPDFAVFDRLALPLPNLPAGDYTARVQLLAPTGPLPVQSADSLSLAPVSLNQPSKLSLQSNSPIPFEVWNANGPTQKIVNPKSEIANPLFRYPATITIITDQPDLAPALIDPAGVRRQPDRSQAGIHTFIIGPRWPGGDYRLEIGDQVTPEPILAVENWWPRQFDPPEIAVPLEANFADQITVLGYDLPQKQVKAGQAFPVTLYWQAPAHRPPQADFTQFNHLHSSDGALFGGYDRRPLEYYSTLLWSPGEVVVDGYTVPVDADAPPGEYYLDVGFYITVGEAAVNLPLVEDGEMSEVSSITIGPIEVVAP